MLCGSGPSFWHDGFGRSSSGRRERQALVELEHLVISEIGDWKELEAALCGWLPDIREQFEIANRQAAFKGMSNIRGITAETELRTDE